MSFRCNTCYRTIARVSDVRNCSRCHHTYTESTSNQPAARDSDYLTPALLGMLVGMSFSSNNSHAESYAPSEPEPYSGGGGDSGGGGSSYSYDSGSSSDSGGSSDGGGSSGGGE